MADFFQAPDQQDPDAIRKAMLLKMFGAFTAAQQPGLTPGATPAKPIMTPSGSAPSSAQPGAPGTSGSEENAGTPRATPLTLPTKSTNGGPPTAKPIMAAAANNNSGNMEPGNTAPFPDEPTWQKQNPAAPHTPYVEPDLKHRMLMGLMAGLQAFGGGAASGERMLSSYLGDIRKNKEAEANYPQTSAAEAHQRYMDYAAGAKAPLDLKNLQAEIDKRQADAREAGARADALRNPKAQLQHVVIAGPNGEPISAAFDRATGKYLNPDTGEPIAGAKAWEKSERPFNLDEQELQARQELRTAKTPEKRRTAQARIEDIRASRQRPPEDRSPKESHLSPGQKATENRKYQKALDDIEAERRARESGTYVHPHSGELMSPMTNDELFDRKQRAEDEYKDALEAAGETGVRRFNYRAGKYEGGETPEKTPTAKPVAPAAAGGKPNGKTVPPQHQVNDEVMYQGKRHKITAIQNGKATLQPLE